jgi:hypothetical protein
MLRSTGRLALMVWTTLLLICGPALAAGLPDISSIPPDLVTPAMVVSSPAAGLRVRQTTPGWDSTSVYHALYLPRDWTPGSSFPVIFEYGGNASRDSLGDACDGTVEGCNLGYGLSAGEGYIWVCLPFVDVRDGKKWNTRRWWGDPSETVAYCLATVRHICSVYGGDERRLVLCGFSRGSIGCNYIGLRDSTIAPVWAAFLCHSHYDGVLQWPYADADRLSALRRLQRLDGRPQFVSGEGSLADVKEFIAETGVQAPFTFAELGYRNHTDTWALRDCELRRRARAWLREVAPPGGRSTGR